MCVPPEYKLTVNDVSERSRWQFNMRYLQLAVCIALRTQGGENLTQIELAPNGL